MKTGAILSVLVLAISSVLAALALVYWNSHRPQTQPISTAMREVLAPKPLKLPHKPHGAPLDPVKIIAATNQHRTANGLPALTYNTKLAQAALLKAQDMFSKQYFEHESPEGKGPSDIVDSVNYKFIRVGENLALGNFVSEEELVQAWMDSPGHRENILHDGFSEIGISAIKGTYEGNEVWMSVQEFALPLSTCPQPDPALRKKVDSLQSQYDTLAKELETESAQLTTLSGQIETQRAALENSEEENLAAAVESFNKKVDQFNAKRKEYLANTKKEEALQKELRQTVNQLNAQIKAFNTCLEN